MCFLNQIFVQGCDEKKLTQESLDVHVAEAHTDRRITQEALDAHIDQEHTNNVRTELM